MSFVFLGYCFCLATADLRIAFLLNVLRHINLFGDGGFSNKSQTQIFQASLMLHTQTESGIKYVYDDDMQKFLYIFNPIVLHVFRCMHMYNYLIY